MIVTPGTYHNLDAQIILELLQQLGSKESYRGEWRLARLYITKLEGELDWSIYKHVVASILTIYLEYDYLVFRINEETRLTLTNAGRLKHSIEKYDLKHPDSLKIIVTRLQELLP